MTSVDNRVVEMGFNNAAFESKIATTMSSLDKLKTSLDFTNSKKNLGDLSSAANNFSMGNMGSAIENISGKFLALATVGITVLANITTKAFDAGVRMMKSLSLDPIMGGFREYETNLNSIQTVLANTASEGTTLDQVNSALGKLNEYSDQTIYNFGEMARNIGTFTAAGVDLDTSVNSIKGIANIAAISGSNSQQASTAMYQLSQAIANGSVKLMDWNSVVNAGMGGEVFQKALFETGKSLGTIANTDIGTTFEQWTSAGNSFRGSLEEGWLTSEVLTTTLQGFTGDLDAAQLQALGYTEAQAQEMLKLGQLGKDAATKVKTLTQLLSTVKEAVGSGWSKSFQMVFGDFEEAKTLFTSLSDVIGRFVGAQADKRNEMLQGWKDLGGRFMLIEGFQAGFKALFSVLKPIKEAFRDIFPPMTAQRLADLTWKFRDLMQNLIPGQETLDKIKTIFGGLFGAIEIGWTIIKETVNLFKDLFSIFADATGGGALDFLTEIGVKFMDLNDALVGGGKIAAFFDTILEKIKTFIQSGGFISVFETLTDAIKNPIPFIKDLSEKIKIFFDSISIKGSLDVIENGFSKFLGIFKNVDPNLTNSMDDGFKRFGDRLETVFNILKKVGDGVGWFFDKLGKAASWFFDRLGDIKNLIKTALGGIVDLFVNLGPNISKALKSEELDSILKIVGMIFFGKGVGSFGKIASQGLKVDLTGGFLTEFANSAKGLTGTFESFKKNLDTLSGTMKAMQTEIKADALMKIAIALGILTASVVVLSFIDSEALAKAMAAMAIGFGQLLASFAIINKISSGASGAANFTVIAAGLILLSTAMLVLAVAMKIMATMSWEDMAKGLSGIGGGLLLIAAAMQLMPSGLNMVAQSVGLIAIGIALNLMAAAMLIFATMSWEDMAKGLSGLGGGLLLIAAAMHLMPSGLNMVAIGVGLVAVGVALNLMAAAMKIFATMSWEDMAKGMVGVGGGLLILAAALHLMPSGVNMVAIGIGLVAVGVALNLIAMAMKIIATMTWEEIGKGLVGLAGALLALSFALNMMTGTIGGAVAIGIASVSLMLLVKVIKEFSKLKLSDIGKGLLGITAVLVALGLTAVILQPLIPALLGLSIAMFALGGGFALFGLGAQATAVAFQMLAAAGRAGVDVLMYALDQLLTRLPEIGVAFASGLISLAQTLLDAAPKLLESLGILLGQLLQTIIDLAPKLGETLVTLIKTGLETIKTVFPDVVATGFAMLLEFLRGIRDNIGEIVKIVSDIIIRFLDALGEKVPGIIDAVFNFMMDVIKGVLNKLGDVTGHLLPKGLEFLGGFLTGIGQKAVDVMNWFKELPGNILTWLGNLLDYLREKGVDIIKGFLIGILQKAVDIIQWFIDLPGNILTWLGNLLDLLVNVGKDIITGLWNGIFSMKDWLLDRIKSLVGWLPGWAKKFLKIESPSKVFYSIGTNIGEGLGLGINDSQPEIRRLAYLLGNQITEGFSPNAEKMKEKALESIKSVLDIMKDQFGNLDDLNPTIKPVLDLTNVSAEAQRLNKILNPTPTLPATVSYANARLISDVSNRRLEELLNPVSPNVPTEIKFEQNNYSPEALSTADIYRQTRNQIAMAKEELAVL